MRSLGLLLVNLLVALLPGCLGRPEPDAASTGPEGLPNDEAAFTLYMSRRLATAFGPEYDIAIDGRLKISIRGGPEQTETQSYLCRLWDYCARDPSGCAHAVNQHVASALEAARDFPIEREDLRIVVRTAEYLADWPLRNESDPFDEIVAVPLAGDLMKVCVADQPHSMMPLRLSNIKSLELSASEAIALCERNTDRAMVPLELFLPTLASDVSGRLDGDGDYEASRLTRREDWAALAKGVEGRLVVAVPHNGLVLYDDTARPGAANRMRRAARAALMTAPQPLSADLFEWTGEGWRPFAESAPAT